MKTLISAVFSVGLLLSALCAAPAFAGGHSNDKVRVFSTVEQIDAQNKTFTVAGQGGAKMVFATSSNTEFEIERDRREFDAAFSDIRVGDWVKVKAYRSPTDTYLAREVEIQR